jgi:hypothetical protein
MKRRIGLITAMVLGTIFIQAQQKQFTGVAPVLVFVPG